MDRRALFVSDARDNFLNTLDGKVHTSLYPHIKIGFFDFLVPLLVEWANFDAYGTAVILRKIWEAYAIIKYGHQPVIMLHGSIIKRIYWTIPNTAFAPLTKIQNPGVFIAFIKR